MSVLKNRQVLLFPDLGATDYWRGKMEMMRRLGIEVSLFDFMENNATDEERKAGYDIADFLLKATGKREQRGFTHYAEREWVRANKSNYNDLISDFNLYLCERFGYKISYQRVVHCYAECGRE